MSNFEKELQDFLREYERTTPQVESVVVKSISVNDESAEVIVYNRSGNDAAAKQCVVTRRDGVFTIKKLL